MENSNKTIPPHLNAEVYKNDTTGTNTMSHLDHIHIHSDGSILVGCSELTGRYWNGAAGIFKTVSEGQIQKGEIKKSINLATGTADGCFLQNSSKVLLCEDSGTVSIWSKRDDAWKTWNEEFSVTEHDNAALAVSCLDPGKEYVTVGGDGNIKVWDVSEMICIRNYNAAHAMAIYGVAAQPQSLRCFATGSLDHYVTLWDDNISKPVVDLVQNNCGIRCVQWLDENRLMYGDNAGVLRLVDIRNSTNVQKLTEFSSAVHRLAVHPDSCMVAVCCDNKIVSVCDVNENGQSKVIYHDRHMHGDSVRGVAWGVRQKNDLLTIGWDGEIKTHRIVNN